MRLDAFRISDKAMTLIMEIGFDEIATATSFIDYIMREVRRLEERSGTASRS